MAGFGKGCFLQTFPALFQLLRKGLSYRFGFRSALWCYAAALIIVVFVPQIPSVLICIPLLIVSFFIWRLPLIAISIALFLSSLHAQSILDSRLPAQYEGVDIVVIGQVEGLPQHYVQGRKASSSFTFNVEKSFISPSGVGYSKKLSLKKLRLNWYRPDQSVLPGQVWQFVVRLKRPRGFANSTGFDYEKWLVSQRYDGTGYVRGKPVPRLLGASKTVDSLRLTASKNLQHSISGEWSSVLPALVVADKQSISYEQWQLVSSLGLNHLLAISGLHVGFVALLGAFIGIILQRIVQFLSGFRIELLIFPPLFSLLAALVYSALAGFSLPTVRALIMVAVVVFLLILRRKISLDLFFLVALVAVLTADPLAPLAIGFWLSFAAVSVLLWSLSGRHKLRDDSSLGGRFKKAWQLCRAQGVLWLGMLIPLAVTVGKVSLLSPLANLIAVPVVTLLVVPLALLAAFIFPLSSVVGQWLGQFAANILQWLFDFLAWLVDIVPLAMIPLTHLSMLECILVLMGAGLLLLPRFGGSHFLALLLMAPLIVFTVLPDYEQRKNKAVLTMLDVGQGTSLIFQENDFHLVYDVGAAFSPRFNVGRDIVADYLWRRNVNRVDVLILSHGDADHSGGYQGFIERVQATDIVAGEPERLPVFEGLPSERLVKTCSEGLHWQLGSGKVEVLWPRQSGSFEVTKSNNRSCVVLLSVRDKRILLVGDIEKSVELALLKHPKLAEPVDVLLVPHHGSRSSSSLALIQQLQPEYGLVSSGYRNSHGHPHQKVVERYHQYGVQLLNTSEVGAVTLVWSENNPLQLTRQRDNHNQWWRSL